MVEDSGNENPKNSRYIVILKKINESYKSMTSIVSIFNDLSTVMKFLIGTASFGLIGISIFWIIVEFGPSTLRDFWIVTDERYSSRNGWVYYEINVNREPTHHGRFRILGDQRNPTIAEMMSQIKLKADDNVNIREEPGVKSKIIGRVLRGGCVLVNSTRTKPEIPPKKPKDPTVLSGGWIYVYKTNCF